MAREGSDSGYGAGSRALCSERCRRFCLVNNEVVAGGSIIEAITRVEGGVCADTATRIETWRRAMSYRKIVGLVCFVIVGSVGIVGAQNKDVPDIMGEWSGTWSTYNPAQGAVP